MFHFKLSKLMMFDPSFLHWWIWPK